jgi:OPA family glycerol-3-phosphate transporter-like MFS transporter
MASANNVITSMIPLHLKDHFNSGRLAGIINGFCYLGSTVSTYGLGIIADRYQWNAVFYVLLGAAVLVTLLGIVFLLIRGRRTTEGIRL